MSEEETKVAEVLEVPNFLAEVEPDAEAELDAAWTNYH